MSESSDCFSEDDHQDKVHLTTSALLIRLNVDKSHWTSKRVKDLQEKLLLQQERLRSQQLHLLEQAKHLKRQEQKIYEASQLLTDGRLPNYRTFLQIDRQTDRERI